jgi:hypothetical protein
MDWERLTEVLIGIIVLAFLVERALALLFESRFFIERAQGKSLKEIFAFVVGAGACWIWDFDAFSIIFLKENVTVIGMVLTGAVVAGGSKASVKLFRDVLGFKSQAENARLESLKASLKGGTQP